MYTVSTYITRPNEVDVFNLDSGSTDVILRKNIQESTDESGGTIYTCTETQFRYYGMVDRHRVAEEFDAWWATGAEESTGDSTMEKRIADLEEALNLILEGETV